MPRLARAARRALGLRAARTQMVVQDKHVYRHVLSRGLPLVQEQDHLVIYRQPAC